MGPSSHFSILASHTELLQTAVLRRPVTHSPIAATPCGGAARGFLCTGNGCRLRRRTRPTLDVMLSSVAHLLCSRRKLVICAQGPKAHTRFHQPAQCNNVYAQRSYWMAGKFYFTRNMAAIFFFFCSHFGLLPKTLNTSNLDTCMYIKNLCQRYVLVTHNKASAGPRSASACDAPNTTTRALRVSALHAVHGCAGQPLLSAEPNRTQPNGRLLFFFPAWLATMKWKGKMQKDGRRHEADGMCFTCRYP
jgi:hypothetical protein